MKLNAGSSSDFAFPSWLQNTLHRSFISACLCVGEIGILFIIPLTEQTEQTKQCQDHQVSHSLGTLMGCWRWRPGGRSQGGCWPSGVMVEFLLLPQALVWLWLCSLTREHAAPEAHMGAASLL